MLKNGCAMFDRAGVQLEGFVASASCRFRVRISSNRVLASRIIAAMAASLRDAIESGAMPLP
jgi:hypothetical protein